MATATTSRKQTLFYDRESGHYYRFIMPAPGCQCLLCDVCGRPLGGYCRVCPEDAKPGLIGLRLACSIVKFILLMGIAMTGSPPERSK